MGRVGAERQFCLYSGDAAGNHIPTGVSTVSSWAYSGTTVTTISPSVPHRNTSEDQPLPASREALVSRTLGGPLPALFPPLGRGGLPPWEMLLPWGSATFQNPSSAAGPAQDSFSGCQISRGLYWTIAVPGHFTGWYGMSFGAS